MNFFSGPNLSVILASPAVPVVPHSEKSKTEVDFEGVTHASGLDDDFDLFFWDGKSGTPELVGKLPRSGGKAEGLLVLADSPSHIDLLVLFDSLPSGQPLSLRLHRGSSSASL